jgi:hypothetical protein
VIQYHAGDWLLKFVVSSVHPHKHSYNTLDESIITSMHTKVYAKTSSKTCFRKTEKEI